MRLVGDIFQEIRYAARVLARSPGHSIAVIGLLALGIGSNAAMFSLVHALFLRELPVQEPRQLVQISPGWSNPLLEDFRNLQQSFSGVFGTGSMLGTVVTTERGEQVPNLSGTLVSGNYFHVLGVRPAVGRFFDEAEDQFTNPNTVVVISHAFWRRQFGADPGAIGRSLRLSGTPFTIIGVTPATFTGDQPGRFRDFWVPMNTQPVAHPIGDNRLNRGYRWLSAMGRLGPGVTIEQAQAEAAVIFDRIAPMPTGRQRDPQRGIRLESASHGFGGFRRTLGTQVQVLAGIVALVLLIVWTNVTALVLARGAMRQREIAVRLALGCGRLRLWRQFLVEGVLLTAVGGLIGIVLAPVAARALLRMQWTFGGVDLDLAPGPELMLFAAGLSFLTAIAFSFAPALRAFRENLETALKNSSRGATARSQLLLRGVIAVQIAFSVVLVVLSLQFARSLMALRTADIGFNRDHVITVTVNSAIAGYREPAEQGRLAQRLLARLAAVPGVRSASAGLCAVLMGCSRAAVVSMDGTEARAGDPSIWINPVSPNYFETTGILLTRGRSFGPQDRPGSPPVAIVTEALARFYFPAADPIGKRFVERPGEEPVEIVGVVRDLRFVGPRQEPIRMAFLSFDQNPGTFSYIQVSTHSAPGPLVPAVRQAILAEDSRLNLLGPEVLANTLDQLQPREVLLGRAGSLFGSIALVLACIGVYGMTTYLVAARTAELGIRLAIGARPRAIVQHVLWVAVKTVLPGMMLGIGAATASARLIEALLFGIPARDPATLAAVVILFAGTTVLAAGVPALRASRIDPLRALRSE